MHRCIPFIVCHPFLSSLPTRVSQDGVYIYITHKRYTHIDIDIDRFTYIPSSGKFKHRNMITPMYQIIYIYTHNISCNKIPPATFLRYTHVLGGAIPHECCVKNTVAFPYKLAPSYVHDDRR